MLNWWEFWKDDRKKESTPEPPKEKEIDFSAAWKDELERITSLEKRAMRCEILLQELQDLLTIKEKYSNKRVLSPLGKRFRH